MARGDQKRFRFEGLRLIGLMGLISLIGLIGLIGLTGAYRVWGFKLNNGLLGYTLFSSVPVTQESVTLGYTLFCVVTQRTQIHLN